MDSVSHREMRNDSAEILRRAAAGETIQVTNRGRVAALIVPPDIDPLSGLVDRGQARAARAPLTSLRSVHRRTSDLDSRTIIAEDRRGP